MADTTTYNARIILRNDTAEAWTAANPVLKAGEAGIETDTHKFKFGDGTTAWKNLDYAGADEKQIKALIAADEDNFTTVVPNEGEDDLVAIRRVITAPKKGDICAVKRELADGKYSYTGYVRDLELWNAMDGNYSAENVYFTEDLTYTKQIGELPATVNGSGTIAATGKNVKEILSTILAKKQQPSVTQPAMSLSGQQNNQNLEVGSTVSKSGTLTCSLSAGSYTYGPATGITAKTYSNEVKYADAVSTDNIASGTAKTLAYSYNFVLGETVRKVQYTGSATYNAGAKPKDNLGGDATVAGIAAGSKSATTTTTYTPYRNFFYGVDNTTGAIDSALIRSLTAGGAPSAKTLGTLAASSKTNPTRVIVAIPNTSSINVKKVLMPSAMNADATASFVKQTNTVLVAGANGTDFKIAYKIWVYQPASIDSTETYAITLG